MTNNSKTPATVRELGDLAHAAGVTPSVYLMRTMAPEGWQWVETDPDDGYYEGPATEAVDSVGETLPLSMSFDPEDGRAVITLGDPGSPFDMNPESARTLAMQLLEAASRLEQDLPALLGEHAQRPAVTHPSWCDPRHCEFYDGVLEHAGSIGSGLMNADGYEIQAEITMYGSKPLVVLKGVDEDYQKTGTDSLQHLKNISAFIGKVQRDVEVSLVEMDAARDRG